MKKLISSLAALAVVVAMTLVSCNSQTVGKATLKTDLDTLSYLIGMTFTEGLDQYLSQQGMDEYKEDFFKGLAEGMRLKEDDKKSLARVMGLQNGLQMGTQWIPGAEDGFFLGDSTLTLDKEIILAAFVASAGGKETLISKEGYQEQIEPLAARINEKKYVEVIAENTKFLEENAAKEDVITLPSGLQYKVITEGTGEKPVATDKVRVHYHGTTIDGKVFDSSVERNNPAQFMLNGVIRGWTEGLQLMPVGSKYIFYIPADLAYGNRGTGTDVGPYSTLIFEVELLDIIKD